MSQPATTREDPRVARSRAAALAAASELLLEGGDSHLTVDAVSARSGVAKTTIYRHWPTRDALLLAAVEALVPDLDESAAGMPFEDALRATVRMVTDMLRDERWRRVLPAIMELAQRNRAIAAVRHENELRQERVFRTVVEAGVAEGRLPPDTDVDEAVLQLVGPVLAAALGQPDKLDDAFADRLVDLFLRSRAC